MEHEPNITNTEGGLQNTFTFNNTKHQTSIDLGISKRKRESSEYSVEKGIKRRRRDLEPSLILF